MIKEFEFYHGVVFTRLFHDAKNNFAIKPYPTLSNSSYVINEDIGIYIKYSKKRMTPWSFSFNKLHQDEIVDMKNKLGKVFVILVCHNDGVVCLNFNELKQVLDAEYKEIEWITASRRPREKYTIKGSDGRLKLKIGENEFPKKILNKGKTEYGAFRFVKNMFA